MKPILPDKSWDLRISSFLEPVSGPHVRCPRERVSTFPTAATLSSINVEVFLFTILERRIYEPTHEREVHRMPPRFPAGN